MISEKIFFKIGETAVNQQDPVCTVLYVLIREINEEFCLISRKVEAYIDSTRVYIYNIYIYIYRLRFCYQLK